MRRLTPLLLGLLLMPAIPAYAAGDGAISTAPSESKPAGPTPAGATLSGAKPAEAKPGAAPTPQNPDARYQTLLAQAKAAAPYADWQGLRVAFAERPSFKVVGQDTAKGEMFKAVETGDCGKALAEAKAVIAEAFVDADAHLVAAYCDDKLGDSADATWERDVGLGLLKSIETGDGMTPADAFTVIDVDEEYALMRAKAVKVTSQALVQQGGHAYDALTTVNDKGESATYYFLIDRVLAAEASMMTPGAVREGGPPGKSP